MLNSIRKQITSLFSYKHLMDRFKAKDIRHFDFVAQHFSNYQIESENIASELKRLSLVELDHSFNYLYSILSRELEGKSKTVLELCAGNGLHTVKLLETGSEVVAVDISAAQLRVLQQRTNGKAKTIVADMEQLPFPDALFDVVVVIQSLSYGLGSHVDNEVKRVLKSGVGTLIVMDCLGNNPFYQIGRLRGLMNKSRSILTIIRMPRLRRVISWSNIFENESLFFFTRHGNLIFHGTLNELAANARFSRMKIRITMAYRFIFVGDLRK